MTSRFAGFDGADGEAEHVERPGARGRRATARRRRLGHRRGRRSNDGPIGPRQRIALCSTAVTAWRERRSESLGGVDRPEHLLQRGAVVLELEAELLADADHAMRAPSEPVPVDLVAVAEPGLHDPLAAVDLVDETMDVGHEVVVDLVEVGGDDGAEQQAAEAGRRVRREHEVAERDPPGRRHRPRVPHLQLSQQHARTLSGP